MEQRQPQVGDVWTDNDPRSEGREVVIDRIDGTYAYCHGGTTVLRTKAADGKTDCFTVMSDSGHTTMNVVGKIRYEGEWPKVGPRST